MLVAVTSRHTLNTSNDDTDMSTQKPPTPHPTHGLSHRRELCSTTLTHLRRRAFEGCWVFFLCSALRNKHGTTATVTVRAAVMGGYCYGNVFHNHLGATISLPSAHQCRWGRKLTIQICHHHALPFTRGVPRLCIIPCTLPRWTAGGGL